MPPTHANATVLPELSEVLKDVDERFTIRGYNAEGTTFILLFFLISAILTSWCCVRLITIAN